MSNFLHGLHDLSPASEHAGNPGFNVISVSLTSESPDHYLNHDNSIVKLHNAGVMTQVRINMGYGPGESTIPSPADEGDFFAMLPDWVGALSDYTDAWIVGNEPNLSMEWGPNEPIAPERYGAFFNRCYPTLRSLGRDDQLIMPAAVGPYNAEIGMGWIPYWMRMLAAIDRCDALALHAYSRGWSPGAVRSNEKMSDGHGGTYYSGFRTYIDFLNAVPERFRQLPAWITEANGMGPWTGYQPGWWDAVLKEVAWWNSDPADRQPVYGVAGYRYAYPSDGHSMQHNSAAIDDFRRVAARGYAVPTRTDGAIDTEPDDTDTDTVDEAGSLPPREWDPRLDEVGVKLEPAQVEPGDQYWKATKVHWLNREESGDNPLIYVDALIDSHGQRAVGKGVVFGWPGTEIVQEIEEKPGEDYGTSMLMHSAGNVYTARMFGTASDKIVGMGLGTPDQPDHTIHTGVHITFEFVTMPADDQAHTIHLPFISAGNNENEPGEDIMAYEGQYDHLFRQYREQYGLPTGLLKSLAREESAFDPEARSPVGAMGLMQFMPASWNEVAGKLNLSDPWDPEQSIHAAAYYLDWLWQYLEGYGRNQWRWVLAAYNWGVGNVRNAVWADVPAVTVRYVERILETTNLEVETDESGPGPAMLWPLDPSLAITQHFIGNLSLYTNTALKIHSGTDNSAPIGTPIRAPADGVVAFKGVFGGYGNYLRIWHPHLMLHTFFAHLREVPEIAIGAEVVQGQIVAHTGNTGRSTAPHSHYEVRLGDPDREDEGMPHDPVPTDSYIGTSRNPKGVTDPVILTNWINEMRRKGLV